MRRLGWGAAWVPGAWASHVGSATGHRLGWRHPWWVLTNRWRALAGNLTATAVLAALPTLLRGEIRAVRTLARGNPQSAADGGGDVGLPPLARGRRARPTKPRSTTHYPAGGCVMRVLFLTDDQLGPAMAGSALRAWELANAIANAGHEVRLAAAPGLVETKGLSSRACRNAALELARGGCGAPVESPPAGIHRKPCRW